MAKSPDPDATAVRLGDLSQAPGAHQSLAFLTRKWGLCCQGQGMEEQRVPAKPAFSPPYSCPWLLTLNFSLPQERGGAVIRPAQGRWG